MNIFYEESGQFKVAAVIQKNDSTYQADTRHGKRTKVKALYFITIFLYVLVIVFNAVSEYFFYNEFGVRYNFIAVDYLIYTNEVIGNIIESYPVLPLFSGVFIVSLAPAKIGRASCRERV